jgi:hypothetical protein
MAVGDGGVAASSRAYARLAEAAARFATGAYQLAFRHRDDYLRTLLPPGRILIPPPAPLPAIPSGEETARWLAWYQLVAGWVGQEQAWSAAAYQAIAEEAAGGRLAPDALEVSARAYLERRLSTYMAQLSDLYSRFVADIMDAAGEWLGSPSSLPAAIEQDGEPVVIEVRGRAHSTAVSGLLIENDHRDRATVRCLATPAGGFALTASPSELELDAGESARLEIKVDIPHEPAAEPADSPLVAGWITIRGHGPQDLVAEVHAYIDPSRPDQVLEGE